MTEAAVTERIKNLNNIAPRMARRLVYIRERLMRGLD
jgi:hypothetical protein